MPTAEIRPREILIIGAGWSGLEIASVLRALGHRVQLVETLDDVGGTWHPALAYDGLAVHTPAFRCQFHDQAGWPDVPRLERVPAAAVYANCRAFAQAHGLYAHLTCGVRVTHIAWHSASARHRVTLRDVATGAESVREADVVISTQFNAPRLPAFAGRETFGGDVLHATQVSSAVVDQLARERPRLVLLGASKGASDLALVLTRRGVPFTWLARRWYWFLSFDLGYQHVRSGRPAAAWSRWLYFVGLGLATGARSTRWVYRAWRAAGLMQAVGEAGSDLGAFHHGWLDETQLHMLRTQTTRVTAGIAALGPREVRCTDGRRLPCDVLLCATGADPVAMPISLESDGAPVAYGDVAQWYRHSVIPAMPQLVFTGYAMFGFGPLNGYHRAAWIQRFLELGLSSAALEQQAVAEGPATYPFLRGSFLFDPEVNVLVAVKEMNRVMGEGLYDFADLRAHYRDIAVRHVYAPLEGVVRFLEARGIPRGGPVAP